MPGHIPLLNQRRPTRTRRPVRLTSAGSLPRRPAGAPVPQANPVRYGSRQLSAEAGIPNTAVAPPSVRRADASQIGIFTASPSRCSSSSSQSCSLRESSIVCGGWNSQYRRCSTIRPPGGRKSDRNLYRVAEQVLQFLKPILFATGVVNCLRRLEFPIPPLLHHPSAGRTQVELDTGGGGDFDHSLKDRARLMDVDSN